VVQVSTRLNPTVCAGAAFIRTHSRSTDRLSLQFGRLIVTVYTVGSHLDTCSLSSNWIPANSFMETVQLRSRVVLLLSLHFVACLLVWQHFFYNKLRRNIAVIHDDEPNFELKRLGPAVEFGLMHVTLLQLCLLPLTVSRSLLAWIATKTSILPMEHMMRLHIQCGYFCCLSVIFGACLYIGFVGHLCQVRPHSPGNTLLSSHPRTPPASPRSTRRWSTLVRNTDIPSTIAGGG
jgi:hypothetical protein